MTLYSLANIYPVLVSHTMEHCMTISFVGIPIISHTMEHCMTISFVGILIIIIIIIILPPLLGLICVKN